MIVTFSPDLLSSSAPLVRVIVCGVLKFVTSAESVLNTMVFNPPPEFARPISVRNDPVPLSAVLVTVNV